MKVRYTVQPEDVPAHYVHVSTEVSELPPSTSDLEMVMPVWTPGSYLVREFAKLLRDVQAHAEEGSPLPVTKVSKNRWKVHKGKATSFTFSYRVYSHDLGVEGLDLNEDHLYFNGATLFCYPDGAKDEPSELVVHLPAHWKAYSELPELGKNPPRFRANNFDELLDYPFEGGNPTELLIRPAGVPHRILLCGRANYSLHQVEEDVGKIVTAVHQIFGELPMPRYTFFYHFGDGWGGLEHLAGTSIELPANVFRPRKDYVEFLSVTAHEYFHLFNVKRIRPKVLGPFDYEHENYTRMLWAMEGMTDYYTGLLLRRAGLFTPRKYFEWICERAKRLAETPGRNHQSLEEGSFDTWIDLYRRHEETKNISVSYYLKGDLASLALDLELRGRSKNERSLDDVLRHLWRHFGKKGVGIPEGDYQTEAEKATGLELGSFFDQYIRGRAELDLAPFLKHAGLLLEAKDDDPPEGEEPEVPGYLGVETRKDDGRPRVTVVLEGGPARRAGITPGDELLALDGYKITADTFSDALKRFRPGEKVGVTLFRRGRLATAEVTLGKAPPAKWKIRADAHAPAEARKVAEGWLQSPWDRLGAKKDEKDEAKGTPAEE